MCTHGYDVNCLLDITSVTYISQKELPLQIQLDILKQLNEIRRLHETLEGVNIVLGFLASSGGKPECRLGDYLQHVLKMKHHPFSSKV